MNAIQYTVGTYGELMRTSGHFSALMKQFASNPSDEEMHDDNEERDDGLLDPHPEVSGSSSSRQSATSEQNRVTPSDAPGVSGRGHLVESNQAAIPGQSTSEVVQAETVTDEQQDLHNRARLTTEEESASGTISRVVHIVRL